MDSRTKTLVSIAFIILLASSSSAAWFDNSWNYRKQISVTNPSSTDVSDFPANISVNTQSLIDQGKMQASCNDVRVATEEGKLLEYNVTNCGSQNSKIFFNTSVTSVNTNDTYFMYYGNPAASNNEKKVETRIVNGKGQRGDFTYWCTHLGESSSSGYDGFWGGAACDGSDNGIGSNNYVGYTGTSNAGNGDWLISPESGKPVLGWGEDADSTDGVDTNSAGYQGFIAYKGYSGSQTGTLGVEVPEGVNAHAWFRTKMQSCDASTQGLALYVGTNDEEADKREGAVAGWMGGDGTLGVSGDSVENEVLDVCGPDTDNNVSSTFVPSSSFIYPYVETFTRGPQDDAIAQIDDFYWSDPQGNEINLQTSVKAEESLFTVNNITTYRNGDVRSFYAENETVDIEIRGEKFKENPQISVISPENNLRINRANTTNTSGVFEKSYTVDGSSGWYDLGMQPLLSQEVFDSQVQWETGNLKNISAIGGSLEIDGGKKSESGTFSTNESNWRTISLQNKYREPIVFASVNSENNSERPNLVKIRDVTANSFQAKFCEPDGNNGCSSHSVNETIGWFVAEESDLNSFDGIETGKFNLTGDDANSAQTISLSSSFGGNAIVVAEQQTYNEAGESIVQVVNTNTNSFDIYLCDYDGADDCEAHGEEEVGWIAIDPAADLPDFIEAGKTPAISDSGTSSQSFSKFNETPVVAATINTNSGDQQAKPARINSLTNTSGNIGYCEIESGDICDSHNGENVAWIATANGLRAATKSGNYTSKVVDAGKRVYWHSYSISVDVPEQTSYEINFSTNKTGKWNYYDTLSEVPSSRYLKYNISLKGNGTETPAVKSLSFKYNGPEDFGTIKENVFYQGQKWVGNYTDSENRKYTFRTRINVTEPGTNNRWLQPVEKRIDFGFQPELNSIRLVAWNGSRMLEIPVQVTDANITDETVESANITFYTSLNESEKREYYLVSTRADYERHYSGLNGSGSVLENSYYEAFFNQSTGGLMSDVKNFEGLGEYMAGLRPLDRYPEVDVPSGLEVDTKMARIDSTASLDFERNILSSTATVEGKLDGSTGYPYNIACTSYHAKSYMICEKNLTSGTSESWQNLRFNGLIFEDERFTNVTFRNANGLTSEDMIGDNYDQSGISIDTEWISFFNEETGDAMAEIFLKKNFDKTSSPGFRISDGSLNDFYQQLVIDSTSASVDTGDTFYTKTARMIYNGKKGYTKVDRVNNLLKNQPVVTIGSAETNDAEKPVNEMIYNVSSDDQNNVSVKTEWSDDTFLRTADILVKGNTLEADNTTILDKTISLKEDGAFKSEKWINTTLNASDINAGKIWYKITVSDVSGKSQSASTEFSIADDTKPNIANIGINPSGFNSQDPGVELNITANITEFTGISEANLYYHKNSGNWSKSPLTLDNSSLFNYTYNGSFTPNQSSDYTFKINGTDSAENNFSSGAKTLDISFDDTWELDSNLSEIVATYDEFKQAGSIEIDNIGDYNKTFDLTAGTYNQRVKMNGSELPQSINVKSGESKYFTVNASGRASGSTEGTDNISITVSNSSSNPASEEKSLNVITNTGGPFLYTTVTEYPAGVTQGDKEQKITVEAVNKGNETASGTKIEVKPPSKWTAFEGYSFKSESTYELEVGETKLFTTYVNVDSNATTGDQEIEIISSSENDTQVETVTVQVQQKSQNNTIVEEIGGGGPTGPEGPSSQEQVEELSDQIFNTTESFEIVRGEDQNFTVGFQNPTKFNLTNITANVEGIQSQYVSITNPELGRVNINESKNITVQITAPEYFQTGDYSLNFNISGKGIEDFGSYADYFDFTLNKDVDLGVRAISKDNASDLLNNTQDIVQKLEDSNMSTGNIESLVSDAESNLEEGNYGQVQEIYREAQSTYQTSQEVSQGLDKLEKQIKSAEGSGLDVGRARQVASLAEAAMERGAYTTAAERLEEAQSIYQLETAGEVNWIYEIRSNWKKILLGLIIVSFTGFLAKLRYRLYKIRNKLRDLESKEKSLEDLKIQKQKKAFEEKEISLSEYEESIDDYNNQIIDIIEKRVELQAEEANISNFKKRKSLAQERDQLNHLIKETQQDYVEGNISDTEVYEEKVAELTSRLSEIEGEIAEIDATAEVRSQSRIGRIMEKTPFISSGGETQ